VSVLRVPVAQLPSALDPAVLDRLLGAASPAVFLDYDGVLAEIAETPAAAVLTAQRRAAVIALASRHPVVIVSGRDLADVRAMVGIDGLIYAGSHGFDVAAPGGLRAEHGAEAFLPALDDAERRLRARLQDIPGAWVERKRFAVTAHYRQVAPADIDRVTDAFSGVATASPRLRATSGKKVYELRPALDWDKGRAVRWLIGALGLDQPGVVSVYIGDDETDEDAFVALAEEGEGLGVIVGDHGLLTAATARLRDPDEARVLLERLACR
jgi:trehalose 6-phosphate phosphatase